MPDSYGPRTYLVGQILPMLLTQKPYDEAVREAIRLADLALDTMGNRTPK